MAYSFADYNIEINGKKHPMPSSFVEYETSEKPDFSVSVTQNDIEYEKTVAEQENFTEKRLEVTAAFRKIAEELPLHNAFVLHSVLIDVDGTGVVFAAHSGTGKTTHVKLWQQLLGEKMTVVNGDKPLIRFFGGKDYPVGYGTPWNGKERMGTNGKCEIKHICFIERAKENSCERMKKSEILDLIMNQVYMPKNPMSMLETMGLIQKFIDICTIWKIKCNMDISAAKTAYNKIFSGGIKYET